MHIFKQVLWQAGIDPVGRTRIEFCRMRFLHDNASGSLCSRACIRVNVDGMRAPQYDSKPRMIYRSGKFIQSCSDDESEYVEPVPERFETDASPVKK